MYIQSWHPHTCREYTSEPPTPIDFDLILFLALAWWAAGRGYWKSSAAHTLDIYKPTNHWNHRNAVFHFACQASCHADHAAVIQASKLRCTALSFPSFFDIFFLAPTPLFSLIPFFPWHSAFHVLSLFWFLQLLHLHLSILHLKQRRSWANYWQSGFTEGLPAKPACTCLSKLDTVFLPSSPLVNEY